MTKIFGHRGAAGTHPENTMISFQEAERIGADGIELDVQLSRDGQIVVIHDETLDRTTTGEGLVKDHTLMEIRQFDASYKFPDYGVCKVPSLEEVYSWALSNSLVLNVELKNSIINYEKIEEKVIELTTRFRFQKRVIISSFNHNSLKKCVKLAPEIEIGVLYSRRKDKPWEYAKSIRAGAIHPNFRAVTGKIIKETQKQGVHVRPYTVNNLREMERLLSINTSALITDYPEKAIKLRKQIANK